MSILQIIQKAGGYGMFRCDECTQFVCITEHEPYGETTTSHETCECACLSIDECPACELYLDHVVSLGGKA